MRTALALAVLALAGCAETSQLPPGADKGAEPTLPAPHRRLIPTVHVPSATGSAPGETPRAGAGMRVNAFATGLAHPRWAYVLPNGAVPRAEPRRPQRTQ